MKSFLKPSIAYLFLLTVCYGQEIGWKGSGKQGAVAAGRQDAVAAGMQLLKEGGNAADASIATILALSVTDYGLFAIGGEVPLLIYNTKTKRVDAVSGVGSAPLDPRAIDWFYKNTIPSKGSMKASLCPGAVDLCTTVLQKYGTVSFKQAVAPTLAILKKGKKSWHQRLHYTLTRLVEAEERSAGDRIAKLQAARDRFYTGDIADELEAWYIETGAFLRKRDLAAHHTKIERPVSINYRGYQVYKCGTWTQGPYLCQTLQILEGFNIKKMGHLSTDHIHHTTEALKLGFADRDTYYGDPNFVDVPLKTLLSNRYARLRQKLINPAKASLEQRPGDPVGMKPLLAARTLAEGPKDIPVQDTTTCVVADKWGNVVAATPSCNLVGNLPGPSGVTQGNRVRSLNTTPGHPNRVEAGKRPRITLTPTLVLKDNRPILAVSVAGGDLQDQTTLNLLINHIDFGMLPEKAVTAPRFNTAHHQNSFDPNPNRLKTISGIGSLRINESITKPVQNQLKKRGHKLSTTKGAIGMPVMIFIDPKDRTFHAAGDPKAGRHAAAF